MAQPQPPTQSQRVPSQATPWIAGHIGPTPRASCGAQTPSHAPPSVQLRNTMRCCSEIDASVGSMPPSLPWMSVSSSIEVVSKQGEVSSRQLVR